MTAVDSGISMGMLGKFSLLAPKQSTAVCMRASVCASVRAGRQRSPVGRMQTHTQLFPKIPKIYPPTAALNSKPTHFKHTHNTLFRAIISKFDPES